MLGGGEEVVCKFPAHGAPSAERGRYTVSGKPGRPNGPALPLALEGGEFPWRVIIAANEKASPAPLRSTNPIS